MDKIFVDSDIVLDLLEERHPHYTAAAHLFSKADRREVKLFVSSLCFTNLHYILRKHYTTAESRKVLLRLKVLVNVLMVDDKIIELALASPFKDFEDAVQYHTATENNIQILVTRNLKDYKHADITVVTAEGYLKSLA